MGGRSCGFNDFVSRKARKDVKSIKINDNISLHYLPMQKLKATSIGIYIIRPLSKETAAKNALIPSVLKCGCEKCPNTESIAKYLEELYGARLGTGVLKKGENQILHFNAEAISDKYAPNGEQLTAELSDLLLSVTFRPVLENGAFKRETVERERKNQLDNIRSIINDKKSYAEKRCIEEMFGNEAYAVSRLGTESELEKIDEKSLYEHYLSLLGSSRIEIFVCGDADADSIAAAVRKYISGIEFSLCPEVKAEIFAGNDGIRRISESMEVTQGKLCIGFTTKTPPRSEDYAALVVANSIFGQGTHSKLFNNVREKLSLAYYASSNLERFKGIMLVNAGIEFESYQRAYDEIMLQLDEMKKGNITDREIEYSISSVINKLNSYCDDQLAMQMYYLKELLLGTNEDIESRKEKIRAVTREDVVRVISRVEADTVYFLKN